MRLLNIEEEFINSTQILGFDISNSKKKQQNDQSLMIKIDFSFVFSFFVFIRKINSTQSAAESTLKTDQSNASRRIKAFVPLCQRMYLFIHNKYPN